MRPQELHGGGALALLTQPARMAELDGYRYVRKPLGKARHIAEISRLGDEAGRELEGNHSQFARLLERRQGAPEHLKHLITVLKRPHRSAGAPQRCGPRAARRGLS